MATYPIYEYGGSGPVVLMSVGNGFPPEVYAPMLQPLLADHRVIAALPRPLWPNPPDPEALGTWEDFADDLLNALDMHGLTDVVAVGHSLGGVVNVIAAARKPERFQKLIVLDPVMFPPNILKKMAAAPINRMAERALKRQAQFQTKHEAFEVWRGKSFFKPWSDDMLRQHVDALLVEEPDSQVIRLAWSPAWEARIYETLYAEIWTTVRQLPATLPILAVRGGDTDVFIEGAAALMRDILPQVTLAQVDGHGHTFPMTAPEESGMILHEWLQQENAVI